MSKFKLFTFLCATASFIVIAACAPAAAPAPPTSDAAMMAKETDAAMMTAKETDTVMMAKETESAMMTAKETDTAMMVKETDTAMMAKETDTAMMTAHETETAVAKPTDAAMSKPTEGAMMMLEFPAEQFAAHFVDSMPMHKATLDKLPAQVLLNFNFTLSDASTITIEKDGKALKTAPGKLGDKKLSMTADLPSDAGMGLYLVKYKACWPDNSCHDGQFAFYVK
ncbi:MAG: hypothetical protein EYC68_18465 [Chloroflexota bacterium]|nr:MAG: hypothetical protein EYC68_18465 [Chloroflexota bacterium]